MKIVAIIPARYSSTRFKGKPLVDIYGKPMLWWVYKQVKKISEISEVYVATDDIRIGEVCEKLDMEYVLTSDEHVTSTERLFEVANKVKSDYYICVNGDEPLIDSQTIQAIIPTSENNEGVYIANLMTEVENPVEVIDNTNIKVITDINGFAIYMSRSPIPHPKASMEFSYKKHLGVLAYNYNALKFFSEIKRGKIESIEDINELRFIENNQKIKMIEVKAETLSVDTPKDLDKVKNIIQKRLEQGVNIYE